MSSEEVSSRSSSSSSDNDEENEASEHGSDQNSNGKSDDENVEASPSDDDKKSDKSNSDEDDEVNENVRTIQQSSSMRVAQRALKLEDETIAILENENFVRRSSRQRRVETNQSESSSGKSSPPQRKRPRPSTSTEESEEDEESESSDSDVPRKARKTNKGKSKVETRNRSHIVTYREPSSDSESESDQEEIMDFDEEETRATVETIIPENGNTDTIEKVLKHRDGVPGATGSQTTWYNIQNQGDPNDKVAELPPLSLERQYLIKWVNWSHLHNTWESESSLTSMGAKGIKKLENYLKKLTEVNEWRQRSDKEYVEAFDCEQVMNEEILEQYKEVERVIAHQVSRDKTDFGEKQTEFLIKWVGLPYSECTWEDENLIRMRFASKIDEYFLRTKTETLPIKSHSAFKRRPKFQKLESMPEFLYPNDNPEFELRDYQLEGLNWLLHAWCKDNSVILADEMGLGKTIQTISFLSSLFHLHDLYGPFLVVVPLSTIASWVREFAMWGADMNVVTYMGDSVSRQKIREFELHGPGKKIKFNALLTTYEILMKDHSFLRSFAWASLVVDEAHRLKNNDSLLFQSLKTFNTNHRLLITGTPLQNSLKELWALLHFIMPQKFDNWPEFESNFKFYDRDHKAIAALHKRLEPFLLRRVKKDVEKSLPAKVEQILRVDMTAAQKQFYKWILTRNYDELTKGVKGSIKGFVNIMMELKKCCNHASLVREYDHIPDDAQSRLHQLLKSSGKLLLLDKLLCRLRDTGHRVLIFSQMVMMLDILQEYMQLRRFLYQRLDGSMGSDSRKQALDHFNQPDSADFCFLLSTRAGGLGINLATADTVIIFDSDWNPQNDLQAMSRAHRIGQKKQVNIYRLVTKTSVEEDIVERAKRKLVLDHLVIQQMDTSGHTILQKGRTNPNKLPFDKADLNAILKFGAEELFREKEGEEAEPDVDLDDILMRAEVKQCENPENENELLNSFKYANVDIDENEVDRDIAMSEIKKEQREKNWDEIIPEDQLEKIKEEARRKEDEMLNLGPRQRNKIQEEPPNMDIEDEEEEKKRRRKKNNKRKTKDIDSDADASSDSDDETRGRKGSKKAVLFSFTEKEVKSFIKSFRKFSHPLERLVAITQDAELEEHSTHEVEELAREIIRMTEEAEQAHAIEKQSDENNCDEKKKIDRGPSIKIGSAEFRVNLIFKQHTMLEPLHQLIIESQQNLREFEIPGNFKPVEGWDVDWTNEDDRQLLQGIHKYGFGSWEQIKMDPEFGLADKIWLKDKAKKPNPSDLTARTQKLLNFLSRAVKKRKLPKNEEKKEKKAKKDKTKDEKKKHKKVEKSNKDKKRDSHAPSVNSPASPQKASTSKEKEKKNLDKAKILSMRINKEKYGNELSDRNGSTFKQCVEIFRPVIKYIKKMISEGGPISTEGLKSLRKLGDHITDYVASKSSKSEPNSRQERWHSITWIFLSKFITPEQDPVVLLDQYRRCVKNKMIEERKNNQKHHGHHHSSSHSGTMLQHSHSSHLHQSSHVHHDHNMQSATSSRVIEDGHYR